MLHCFVIYCTHKCTETAFSNCSYLFKQSDLNMTCVGKFVLLCSPLIVATIVVRLCKFPLSFRRITTQDGYRFAPSREFRNGINRAFFCVAENIPSSVTSCILIYPIVIFYFQYRTNRSL